jgi:hypothetical protein
MNAAGFVAHTPAYHITMVSSVCVAGVSFLSLVVLMIVTENARLTQAISHSRAWGRLKIAFVTAGVTGLLASLPFASASGTHSVTSFLVWEVIYASMIALGTLVFAVMVARVATGEIGVGDYEPHETGMFDDDSLHRINPASSLPMNGSLDIAGNPYGCDSHSTISCTLTE